MTLPRHGSVLKAIYVRQRMRDIRDYSTQGYEIIITKQIHGAAERCRTGSTNCVCDSAINAMQHATAEKH